MKTKKLLVLLGTVCLALMLALPLGTGCAAPAPTPTPTPAAEVTKWDYYIFTGLGHGITVYMMAFADEVRERTNGLLDITVYPAGELPYRATEAVEIAGRNEVQIAEAYMGFVGGSVPISGITGMPFLIRNTAEVGSIWPILEQYANKELGNYGGQSLFYFCWPPQNIWGRGEPVRTLDDFKGKKIRANDPRQTEFLRRVGASSITLTTAEVPMAMERGLMDGFITAAWNIMNAKWYEFVEWGYVPDMSAGGPDYQVVNKEALAKLSPEVRETLLEVAKEWQAKMLYEITRDDATDRVRLRDEYNAELTFPDQAEIDEATSLMSDYWDSWAEEHGADAVELLNKIRTFMGR